MPSRAPRQSSRGPCRAATSSTRFVFERIEKDGIPHAGLSTDEEFVRRAYMDAIGLPPSADEVRASSPTRRATSAIA